MNIYVDKLEALMADLGVEIVAPTHGLPITNLGLTMPKVRDGLIADGDPDMTLGEAAMSAEGSAE